MRDSAAFALPTISRDNESGAGPRQRQFGAHHRQSISSLNPGCAKDPERKKRPAAQPRTSMPATNPIPSTARSCCDLRHIDIRAECLASTKARSIRRSQNPDAQDSSAASPLSRARDGIGVCLSLAAIGTCWELPRQRGGGGGGGDTSRQRRLYGGSTGCSTRCGKAQRRNLSALSMLADLAASKPQIRPNTKMI